MSGRFAIRCVAVSVMVCTAAAYPTTAAGQQRRPTAARPAPQHITVRGFGDFGATRFAAADTFKAVLGSSTGTFFGGGVEIVLPRRLFFDVRVSRFQKSGERVFVLDNEVFPLGINMKVHMTPIEVSGGYRFQARGRTHSMTPYVGGGIGWHRYSETSDFADSSENVSETFHGYHALGGVEFRMGRSLAIGGEGQWTAVPNAIGSGLSSASEAFNETNLGGIAFRVRFVIGR